MERNKKTKNGQPRYHIVTDIESVYRSINRNSGGIYDRTNGLAETRHDLGGLTSGVDENSPEFLKAMKRIQRAIRRSKEQSQQETS